MADKIEVRNDQNGPNYRDAMLASAPKSERRKSLTTLRAPVSVILSPTTPEPTTKQTNG